MSRNLLDTSCNICGAPHEAIVLEEEPRPINLDEVGRYSEFVGRLTVANARCTACDAKYLAWVREGGRWPRAPEPPRRFVDLSFRSSFNDEPGPADLPSPEKLREIYIRECNRYADQCRRRAAALLKEADELEERGRTGTPDWESYRR